MKKTPHFHGNRWSKTLDPRGAVPTVRSLRQAAHAESQAPADADSSVTDPSPASPSARDPDSSKSATLHVTPGSARHRVTGDRLGDGPAQQPGPQARPQAAPSRAAPVPHVSAMVGPPPIQADALAAIGNTPLVRLPRLMAETGVRAEVLAKLDFMNPFGSAMDRVAMGLIDGAVQRGALAAGGAIVEACLSSAGLALAAIATVRGYTLHLFMPDDTPESHQRLLQTYGVKILLVPAALGLAGAIESARTEAERTGACFLDQYSSIDTAGAHQHTTAEELWSQTGGRINAIVSGIGTGGFLTGVGRLLKPRQPTLRVVGVEPANARVLRGEPSRPHALRGIGVGFRPESLNRSVVDEVLPVSDAEAEAWMTRAARTEGLVLGLASAAALKAAFDFAGRPENAAKTVVVMLTATAERDTVPFRTHTG